MIMKISSMENALIAFLVLYLCSSCTTVKKTPVYTIEYKSFTREIKIPAPTKEEREEFNENVKGDFVTVTKENGKTYSGYVTENKKFLDKVMKPILDPYLEKLAKKHPVEIINTLAIFGHEAYFTYFGKEYFNWGGDLLDLDDPQEKGPRFGYRYGFDCSGFASMPYDLGVYVGLLNAEDEAMVFSSKGFEIYTKKHNIKDKGGRDGTTNRFRVDTADMRSLGREIFRVKKSSYADPADLEKLQAGDIVLLPEGHAGIVVEILGDFYYLEAGGWVCPLHGGLPFRINEALNLFSEKGELVIRRSLPDYGKIRK